MMKQVRELMAFWKSGIVILVPALLSPLLAQDKEGRCAFVVVLMSIYWMTEALPLPITSLLPVVLFPLLGVLGTDQVCITYLKDTNMMFIGGLIVAIAVEHCNLHKRIALNVILVIGTSPMRLMTGFMLTTMVLSMWISNTATTAMMVPIVFAVLEQLKEHKKTEKGRASPMTTTPLNSPDSEQASGIFDPETRRKSMCRVDPEMQEHPDAETVCYFLGVAYASNLGGAGTLTGSATNLTFKGLWDTLYPNAEGITFATWMIFNVPLMLINVFAAWLWLQILFMRLFRKNSTNSQMSPERAQAIKALIRSKVNDLGPMNFRERCTLFLFVLLVFLWFFREPEFIPGWAATISVRMQDATPVMLVVVLFFMLPSELNFLDYFKCTDRRQVRPSPSLLSWKLIHEKVPWGLVLLLGGGFAMASASEVSGLSRLLGQKMSGLQVLPYLVILAIISTCTTFITEVSSNTAVANIVLPVLANMANQIGIHPLHFMIPATLCCSYAFMLPVATPPNAIVLAASNMRTKDMVKAGFGMNIICLLILFALFPTFGSYIYGLDKFPAYASLNTTAVGH